MQSQVRINVLSTLFFNCTCKGHWVAFKHIVPLQVNVILRLTHLPPFPEYTMDLWRFPRGYGPVRPVSIEGLVISMTRVTKYTQGARFLCQNDDCPCSTGKHFATSLPNLQMSDYHTHCGWQMRVIFYAGIYSVWTFYVGAFLRVSPYSSPHTWSHRVSDCGKQPQLHGVQLPPERGCEV